MENSPKRAAGKPLMRCKKSVFIKKESRDWKKMSCKWGGPCCLRSLSSAILLLSRTSIDVVCVKLSVPTVSSVFTGEGEDGSSTYQVVDSGLTDCKSSAKRWIKKHFSASMWPLTDILLIFLTHISPDGLASASAHWWGSLVNLSDWVNCTETVEHFEPWRS